MTYIIKRFTRGRVTWFGPVGYVPVRDHAKQFPTSHDAQARADISKSRHPHDKYVVEEA